ncbi:hypothetical protein ABID82_005030 [Methylobacterium sp. PvP062]|uniref:Uncharacterized protein n=1 Tax=Methylobacterium radiotolerans TaxID=31998 RepID=A0ABV2NU94_9HYPH|nr:MULTISPECIES: hypothetical protein [unclassified Methylobacterium]MBP2498344.1 hypothetical protein [Methylobacterium sp. PvP105]MBP2505728.1 hypothetical protein [Methylobacterium sp. PvP109]
MAILACTKCHCFENAELLNDRLECIACAGDDWAPLARSSLAKSCADHLKHLYAAYRLKVIRRWAGLDDNQMRLRSAA